MRAVLGPSSGGTGMEECVRVRVLHMCVPLSCDYVSNMESVEVEYESTGGAWGGIFVLQITVHWS